MTTLDELKKIPTRALHVFTFPESARMGAHDPASVGMVELTTGEEIDVYRRMKNDAAGIASALAQTALREVDGKPVTLADGTTDIAWNKMSAKCRALIFAAYGTLHQPTGEEEAGFLKSRDIKVG